MEKLCMVYVTARDKSEAMKIAEGVVDARLAGCANIFEGMSSVYWWQGKKEKNPETVVILKTRKSLLSELEKKIKELHSYSCPCILAVPVLYVNKLYADWIITETQKR